MASIIKANQLQDFGGNSIIGSDGAGNLTTQKTNYPAFSARMSANQTLGDSAWVKAAFDTELLDSDGKYDTSNYRFTPGVAGYYRVSAYGYLQANDGNFGNVAIYKNGSEHTFTANLYGAANYQTQQINCVLYLDADDYVEAYFRQISGQSRTLLGENDVESNFAAERIGS
tara:strand:- start:30 stop:542 length:513 start_codon:yes stop_codon:yes gene_type:complete